MRKIVLELNVRGEADIKRLEDALRKTSDGFDDAERSAERYSGAIKKSNPLVEKLDQKTGGLVNSFLDLQHGVKGFNISLKGMRTALIATGIGAFAVAIGTIVAYWGDIKDFVSGTNRELDRQINKLSKLAKQQQHVLDLLDASDALLKEQGLS